MTFEISIWYHALLDPGEVAICFGDEGTWCSLYKHDTDTDTDTDESYSEENDLISSLISNEDFSNLSENIQTLSLNTKSHASNQLIETTTIDDCNYLRSNDWNIQQNNFWLQ